MISILICVLVLMFYTFFASGDLQTWASMENNDEYQHVLTSNPNLSRDVSQNTGLNEHHIDDLTDRLRAEIRDETSAE